MDRRWSFILVVPLIVLFWLLATHPRLAPPSTNLQPIARVETESSPTPPAPPPSSIARPQEQDELPAAPAELPELRSLDEAFCDPPNQRSFAPNLPINGTTSLVDAIHSPEYPAAIAELHRWSTSRPNDASAARLLRRLETQEEIQRDFLEVRGNGITLAYPPEIADPYSILAQIDSALEGAARLTQTSRRKELYAVVYRDKSELLAVTCLPSWAGGVFDGTLRVVLENGKIEQGDLRHEAMHAQLVPVIGGRPLWFHEGIAQYFQRNGQLAWRPSLSLMVKNRTYVPFASLVGRFSELEQTGDAALVYAESAAMISLLVERSGEAGIARAVSLLREHTKPEGLAGALELREEDLLDYLRRRPEAAR